MPLSIYATTTVRNAYNSIEDKQARKVLVVPGKLVNLVVG